MGFWVSFFIQDSKKVGDNFRVIGLDIKHTFTINVSAGHPIPYFISKILCACVLLGATHRVKNGELPMSDGRRCL